jgi:nucleoside-diphosphate-sugar epimerase
MSSEAAGLPSEAAGSFLRCVQYLGSPGNRPRTDSDAAGNTAHHHPKTLSNARLKRELGFQPRYPGYSKGLEEALRGLSHHA